MANNRKLVDLTGLNPYQRPFTGGAGLSVAVPSQFNDNSLIWRWNESDVSEIGTTPVMYTVLDAVKNPTNNVAFTGPTTTYLAGGTNSSVGPRFSIGVTAATAAAGNNYVAIPVTGCPALPRRFVLQYRLCGLSTNSGNYGWGFGIANGAFTLGIGWVHTAGSDSVIMQNYNPNQTGTASWPWRGSAQTRTLPTANNLISSGNNVGATYSMEINMIYDTASGANPPYGYIGATCRSSSRSIASQNPTMVSGGATATLFGATPDTAFNGAVFTRLFLLANWVSPAAGGTISCELAEIAIYKHAMDL